MFVGALAPAAADARVLCGAPRAPTIARSSKARVYAGTFRTASGKVVGRTVGCVKGGRAITLDYRHDPYEDGAASKVRRRSVVIAGYFAAYVIDGSVDEDTYFDYTHVEVVDLRTGHRRWGCPSGESYGCAARGARVTDLVLGSGGAMAFIGRRELKALGGNGARRTLSTTADPRSLRLTGTRLSWTEDGQPRTARLG
jgi:hypothetical protein